jgi:hypothetical protein
MNDLDTPMKLRSLHPATWLRRAPARRLVAVALLFAAACAAPAHAAIPAGERQVLINLYNSTHGGAWNNNANWCSAACPGSGTPAFAAAGTECNWYGIGCDDAKAHVVAIALPANNLSGPLPDISGLAGLKYFNVAANQLTGSIPALAALSQLQTFYVAHNNLGGSIPALGALGNLGDIALQDNRLTGALPSLAGLTHLYRFTAAGNLLSGAIPSLSGLSALREFDVGDNQLDGSMPGVSALPTLLRLSLDRNRLSGTIPALPATLYTLQIGYNRIGGAVPAAPARLHTPLAFVPSELCPNPLTTTPGANDAGWNAATGFSPWWANPSADNRCDSLFDASFD